jgi:hypothetical protein
MSSRRIIIKAAISLVILCLVIASAFFLHLSTTSRAQNEPKKPEAQPSNHQADELPLKAQRLFAPYWTTEGSLYTTIYIRNAHVVQPIMAKVSLTLGNNSITLPEAFVDSLQTVAIDVEGALIENGETAEKSGGAIIEFEAVSAGSVNAYAQVLDTTRSLRASAFLSCKMPPLLPSL